MEVNKEIRGVRQMPQNEISKQGITNNTQVIQGNI